MFYVSFWILPLISSAAWFSMLMAMLLKWITDGSPHYPSMSPNQHLAYISDIGAQYLKPLFIAGSCITVVTLDAAFIAERWLRHRGVLVRNTTRSEKVLSAIAIVWALAGAAGLILLSNFDTVHYPRLHDGFLLLFIGGYIIAAIFACAEYQRLGVHVRQHRILRISFWIKLAFILVEVVLAICFASLSFSGHEQQAAYFEWVISLVFTFWDLSFFIDLLPAIKNWHHSGAGAPQLEMGSGSGGPHITNNDAPTDRYTNGNGHTNGHGFLGGSKKEANS